jgi:uncharacterized Zn finger protein
MCGDGNRKQMSDLPELTESDVRRWIGEASFGRGEGYFRSGHILDPRLQGDTLKARCLGSRPGPYYVEVTLGREGIVSGDCSCPVGDGGHCKHAAALLLTWVHERDAFLEVEELESALERRSKAELVVLVRRMIARYPDLESLLDLPIVGEAGADRPLDPDVIRRQASSAFHGVGYDEWGAVYGIAQQLMELVSLGDDYAERGQWHNAATVYETVMRQVLDSYGMVQDEEGDLHDVVSGCVEGLGACLEATEELARREPLLRALFDVYHWDVSYGGIDMGYEAPSIILEQATPEEKARVAGWVRGVLPAGDSWSEGYHRQRYGGFLLQLEEDELDDDSFLRVCRETDRWQDLVDRLLALGRVDEAAGAAREVADYELLRLADLFVSHDHADLAENLVRERAQGGGSGPDGKARRDSRLVVWLKERAQERGDLAEALALAETLFWERLGVPGYQEMRDLARSLHRWDEVRAAILARLTDEEKYHLLTEIYLEEGQVDRALESLEKIGMSRWGWTWASTPLRIRVAQAAEEDRPREAIRLYMEAVERLIAARGRASYAEAAGYLVRVRELYQRLGEGETWQALITNLREQNRRLPALKDELNKAGL